MIDLNNTSVHLPLRRARLRRKLISGTSTSGGEIIYRGESPYVAALQHVTLTLKKGDCVALIGHNGSGKTTLLRTMAGIYEPYQGEIITDGKIATMFSSSLSLSDMETGIQNVEYSSILHGISPNELEKRLPEAIDICELGEFIDVPVSMYSEGMRARLGLAMAILAAPDILLIDEAMTTTDAHFLSRVRTKTTLFGGQDNISVMATHSADILDAVCNKAIWLEHGRLKQIGDYNVVSRAYREGLDVA